MHLGDAVGLGAVRRLLTESVSQCEPLGTSGGVGGCRVLGASLGAVVDGGACYVVGGWSARASTGCCRRRCLSGRRVVGWHVAGRCPWSAVVSVLSSVRWWVLVLGVCGVVVCLSLCAVSVAVFFFLFSFSNGVWSASGRCLVRWRRRLACATWLSPVGTS